LWFPYSSGVFILWNCLFHLCWTWGHLLTRAKQDCSCVLHTYNTNAEPSHIQSEKQRCERCCEKIIMWEMVLLVTFRNPLDSGWNLFFEGSLLI
jgi:hypothetical protein